MLFILLYLFFYNFNEVADLVDHALDLWRYFHLDSLVQSFESQRFECPFLAHRPSNAASYLFYLDLFHRNVALPNFY